jgi:hypothetical protein
VLRSFGKFLGISMVFEFPPQIFIKNATNKLHKFPFSCESRVSPCGRTETEMTKLTVAFTVPQTLVIAKIPFPAAHLPARKPDTTPTELH